ncbi:DNA-binding protein [Methanosarcinales archaeon]|nr:MAG: DNA-binding protein [Methanosarcinales archaeon]
MRPRKVILDTNALFIPEIFGVDIFSEIERLGYTEIIVPAEVVAELERLRRKRLKGREKRALNVAISILRKYENEMPYSALRVSVLRDICNAEQREHDDGAMSHEKATGERAKSTDDAIIELALREKAAVLTMDESLRKRLSKKGIVSICLRGGKRLEEAW